MAARDWPYGPTLTPDKDIRYFSPSSLTVADPDSNEGCLRRWWYEKVAGLKPPSTKAQETGTELHAQIENYLLTGEKAMSSLALSGLHMIPTPDPRLLIEHDIVGGDPSIDPMIRLANAPLKVRGVPVAGYIDLVHDLGMNKGVTDVEDTIDPPNTIEVTDWKSTSSDKWIKTPQEMARTIQMTTYGKWAITVAPDTEWVRLSHGYFITKGRHTPRKVTLRVHRDQIEDRWNHIDKLAGSIIDIAKETNPDKVPGNPRACDAFRGCIHADYCTVAMHNSLAELGILDEGVQPVSLLSSLKLKNAATKVPAGTPELEAEKIRLAKEEVLARWPGLDETFAGFQATGLGFPALTGEAAKAYKTLTGADPVAEGGLAEHSFDDPSVLAEVLTEARGIASGAGESAVVSPETTATVPIAPAPAVEAAAEAIEAAAEPKKAAKRTKKAEPDPAPPADEQAVLIEAADAKRTDAALNVFIDCVPSTEYVNLWPLVNQVADSIAKKHGVSDVRDGTSDKLDFGKWKGVISSAFKKLPIPPGSYALDARGSELAEVVAEALRSKADLYVRGVR